MPYLLLIHSPESYHETVSEEAMGELLGAFGGFPTGDCQSRVACV